MHPIFAAGVVCSIVSLTGYALGIWTPYPGRSVTVAGTMVGLSLVFIGSALGDVA